MMETLLNYYYWLQMNGPQLLTSLAIIIVGLEGLVRLTPTKKDDGALERIGVALHKIMDLFRVPNVKIKSKDE